MIQFVVLDPKKEVFDPMERKFDQTTLGHLSIDQIFWLNTTHRKCLIDGIQISKDFCLEFKRNKQGLFDVNGEYSKRDLIKLNIKYESEGLFGLGYAKVSKKNVNTKKSHPMQLSCPLPIIQVK